ncbi:unnamed protein product [Sphenostylis stenocarpa]|uniref:Vacuolar protein sorting-associated protein 54 N-terminal domain-containing protein n=1 Tax=Sphenostylis stenocarpa TaxID=92480 RepID=A0AA86W5Z8_9FABA|nr:unnamed protein product [Sphenostylis stenocarpa]
MDLSKVGEKIMSSVRSARSLGMLPPVPDRPEVNPPPLHSRVQLCGHQYYTRHAEFVFQFGTLDAYVNYVALMQFMRVLDLMMYRCSAPATWLRIDAERDFVPARAAAAAAVARALAGLPPHQRYSFSSSSEELSSIYGSRPQGQLVEELEDEFYEEDFDPIKHVLEHVPAEENELTYFEKQASLRLLQLDRVAELLSRHVMEHHEVMVKGMNLVRELEKDLRIANVICMNGRRHLTSSMNEVSRDLIVNSYSKKKQALLDMLPTLTELQRALDMQSTLESLAEEGNYWKAFQVLSEYLQLLDSLSELSAIQEMSRGLARKNFAEARCSLIGSMSRVQGRLLYNRILTASMVERKL